jgi:hypothetical protein
MRPTSPLLLRTASRRAPAHPATFVVVGLDATALLHLACTVPPNHLRSARGWDEVGDLLVPGNYLAAVFDPFLEVEDPPAEYRGADSSVRLVAYGALTPSTAPLLRQVLAAGVHAFVTRGVDDTPAGFRHHLLRAGILLPS